MTLVAPFEHLYRHAPCGLLVMTVQGVVTEVNDTLPLWLGMPREGVVGRSFTDLLDAGNQLFYRTRHLPLLRLQGEVREVSLSLTRADGSALAVLVNSVVADDGAVHMAVFDVSERAEYERALLTARRLAESSEMRVRVLQASSSAFVTSVTEEQICGALAASASEAFSASATGVFLLSEDGDFVLTGGSDPVKGLIPRGEASASRAALSQERALTVTVGDDDERYAIVASALRERHLEAVTIIPLLREGTPIGVLACFFATAPELDDHFDDLQAALSRLAAQAIVRVRLQRELERLALHDQLTGLANRKLLLETVHDAIERAVILQQPLSVIFLDLDGFKGINDRYGHGAGDAVLDQVATRIRGAVRHEDTVGRYGGDEFVAVCEDADAESAASIAQRIRTAVGAPLEGLPPGSAVTASVGVAVLGPSSGQPPTNDELLSIADNAMYLAKTAGKDRVSFLHR